MNGIGHSSIVPWGAPARHRVRLAVGGVGTSFPVPGMLSEPPAMSAAVRGVITSVDELRAYNGGVKPQPSREALLSLLQPGPVHPCPYLPGRLAREQVGLLSVMDAVDYEWLLARGFRRSGDIVYRPACAGCGECVPMRVPVAGFTPSRSQRRSLRRNADVRVEITPPVSDDERWTIYRAYMRAVHGRDDDEREGFESTLYQSPVETVEFAYRVGRRLIGAGLVDVLPDSLSSVYFYYDPSESRRSLGVFSALCEIAECRRRGLTYWYIGYYIRDCTAMNYKNQYRPHETFGPDGVWRQPASSTTG